MLHRYQGKAGFALLRTFTERVVPAVPYTRKVPGTAQTRMDRACPLCPLFPLQQKWVAEIVCMFNATGHR